MLYGLQVRRQILELTSSRDHDLTLTLDVLIDAAFTVLTATFRVLFVFIVLSHDRRRVVYVNVTCHPTAAWTRQQIREAFPWDQPPRYLLRDRDAIYGSDFGHRLRGFGIVERAIVAADLRSYLDYSHRRRTHLSLDKDAPEPRPIQPPECGAVIERARV
jgi:putative transposase